MQLSFFPVDHFFPQNKYKETCKANKSLVPMYFIACMQPLKTIINFIEKREAAKKQWNLHPKWKITCLHVAVWRQNLEVIQYLLKKNPSDVEARDAINFLPIHYAEAIGNNEIIKLIKSAMKTDYVSYLNIWEKLLKKPTEEKDVSFKYMNEEGNIMKGDSAKFAELTEGAILTQMIFFRNRTALLENLAKTLLKKKEEPLVNAQIKDIKKDEFLCLKKQGTAGWGVITLKKLEPFVPFAFYVGEGVIQSERDKSLMGNAYRLYHFEAHHFRNLIGMINDGFPNCVFYDVDSSWGISYPIIFPIRPIETNDEIFFDYSWDHNIKRMRRAELNYDEANIFLKGQGLLAIYENEFLPLADEIQNGNKNVELRRKLIALYTKIFYFISTPSVVIRLVIEQKISSKEIKSIIEKKYFDKKFGLQNISFFDLFQLFEKCDKYGEINHLNIYEELKDFFWKLLDTYNVNVSIGALQYLVLRIEDDSKMLQPQQKLKDIFNSFENAIPLFESTAERLYKKIDITDEELSALLQIIDHDPLIKKVYLTLFQ